jgi:membrane protein required for colicin V production
MEQPILDQPVIGPIHPIANAPQQAHGFNWVDAIVVIILLVSGGFATMRGFVKEAFVLLSWIAATVVTLKVYPMLLPWMQQQIKSQWGASLTTSLLIFCATLVALLPFTTFIIGKVQGSALSALDRSLGFLFGVLRGVLAVSLLYLVAQTFFWNNEKEVPEPIRYAKTRPILETGAGIIDDMIPEKKKKQWADQIDKSSDRRDRANEADKLIHDLAPTEGDKNKDQPAYDDQSRAHMNELIEQKSR